MSVDPVTLGIKVGLTALSMGLQMMNKIEGPRLDTLDVTLADYGTPIRRFWGVRRLEGCPIIWAKKLREEKVESKGKGGKYQNYKYYGTWAVLLADHPIDKVRRLWFDKHLVFQVKEAGPIGPIVGLTDNFLGLPNKMTSRNFRIYLGTEDQEPDPTMEHWCEDRYGADSCPAYRGCSYIVFRDIPLEKFGNRIPQITCEAISAATDSFPYGLVEQTVAGWSGLAPMWGFTFSPDFTKFVASSGSELEVWDVPTRTRLTTTPSPAATFLSRLGLRNDGTILLPDGNDLYVVGTDGIGVALEAGVFAVEQSEVWVVRDGGGTEYTATIPESLFTTFYFGGQSVDLGWKPGCFVPDSYGDIWAVGANPATITTTTALRFKRLINWSDSAAPDEQTVTVAAASGPRPYACHTEGSWLVLWPGTLYAIDDEAYTITSSTGTALGTTAARALANHDSARPTVWLGSTEYNISDGSVARTVTMSDWKSPPPTPKIYDPINHALICNDVDGTGWAYLDRVGSDGVPLASIIDDVAEWCGIVVDADALDQTVHGYSVVQGTGKDMISPLLDMHDSDCRPHDFAIQFVKRGGASQGLIETSDFVREGDEARYTVSIEQDTDLPRRLSINFADRDKDQQTNTVISQRPLDSVDGVREQPIDLTTYVTTPAEAQQLSDRRFRRLWNERENIENALTMQNLGIEPADVWTLSLDGVERNARLTRMTISQGRIECAWKRDALTLAGLNSSQGANMDGRDDEIIYVPGPAKGIVLETPYLSDSEDNGAPLLHYAAGTYGAAYNFPGVIIYKSDADGNEYSEWNAIESVSKATWGYVSGALNDCDPWCWDRGSTISVNTFGQTLISTTEAAIDADPTTNQAVIGDEIVNFVTATLETDGTYTLTGFKRGRRGTEWACPDHADGELFVLASSLQSEGYGLSEVGTTESFKAQMLGRDPAFSETKTISLAGSTLKPYAPARLDWAFDGSDLQGTIVRRTRLGGSWVGGSTIPLSENSEAYEVDIYNGATFKRTITVTGTNSFTYDATMAAADGITLPTPPTAFVYQMSDAVGRGYALAA